MGRLIDYNDVYNAIQITSDNFGVAKRVVENNMLTMLSKIETVEAIPKDQYESRLKADMVAMLTELKNEIGQLKSYESADGQDLVMLADVGILFNQKINALGGKTDVSNEK